MAPDVGRPDEHDRPLPLRPRVVQRHLFVRDDLLGQLGFLFRQVGLLSPLFPASALLATQKSGFVLRVPAHAEVVRHDGVLHGLALLLEVGRRDESGQSSLVFSFAFGLPPEIKIVGIRDTSEKAAVVDEGPIGRSLP